MATSDSIGTDFTTPIADPVDNSSEDEPDIAHNEESNELDSDTDDSQQENVLPVTDEGSVILFLLITIVLIVFVAMLNVFIFVFLLFCFLVHMHFVDEFPFFINISFFRCFLTFSFFSISSFNLLFYVCFLACFLQFFFIFFYFQKNSTFCLINFSHLCILFFFKFFPTVEHQSYEPHSYGLFS